MPVPIPPVEAEHRQQLTELFHDAVAQHEEVMAECLSLIRLYNLAPSDLFYKYEAFLLSRPSGLRAKLATLTVDSVKELRREIQREQTANQIAASAGNAADATGGAGQAKGQVGVRKQKAGMGMGLGDIGGILGGLSTPVKSSLSTPGHGARRLSGGYDSVTPKGKNETPVPTGSHYRPNPRTNGGSLLETPVGKGGGTSSGRSSPVSGGESPGLVPELGQPFRLRSQPHTLVESLNPHLPGTSDRPPPPVSARPRIALSATSNPKEWDYRYMFEKISQRSESLDEQIDDFGEIIKDAYGLAELGDPHFATDDSIHTVGRILAPPSDTSKASAQALYLESSRLLGSGRRIALRFPPGQVRVRGGPQGVKSFGLYPGCLVGVKGRNGGGGFFAVEEVLLPQPSALPVTPIEELIEYQHGSKLQGEPAVVHIAAGPFTLDSDLLFEPLQAILEVAERERPDVLILMGPFIDSAHPIVASGAITRSPTDIFRDEISSRLVRLIEVSPSTQILLIPSVKDIVSHHVAHPQAMFDKEQLGIPKRIKCMPNPTIFSINEVSFALSTVDVLFHLRREEVLQRAEEAEPASGGSSSPAHSEVKDPMAALVRHVLGQRTFYPLFPVPEAHAQEVNLDVTHFGMLRMESAPDVLVLPSRLKHFSKIVDSTLVINPGFLSRARTAGTFSKLVIHPKDRGALEAQLEEGDEAEHEVYARARAETWKI